MNAADGDFVPAGISPEQFRAHEPAFRAWYAWFGHWATLLVLASFAGYGLAFWVWYNGDNVSAFVIVSAFYLLFRLHRRLLFKVAAYRFRTDAAFAEPLRRLERLRIARKEQGALTELAALITAADRDSG